MTSDEEVLNDLLGALKEADIPPGQNMGNSEDADLFEAAASLRGTEYDEDDEEEAWNAGLDDLLLSAENLNREAVQRADLRDNTDVTQLIDNMPGSDEDLNEINELLKKSDSNEAIKDDAPSVPETVQEPEPEEKSPKKEKKKKKIKFPWSKKQKQPEEEPQQEELLEDKSEEEKDSEVKTPDEQKPREISLEDIEKEEGEGKKEKKKRKEKKEKKEKKKEDGEENPGGFWKRFSEIVFGEDEEEEQEKKEEKPESENDELLKQLEKENKTGSGKKKAKDKKEKKPKEKKEKKPKEKKKKEPKPEKEKQKEPPSKPIGKKNLFLAAIFGLSVLAAILLLNIALSEFLLKQNMESAWNSGNYRKVYQLLYGKRLNEEETQILGRATVVLQLQRKLDSYEFYKKSGDDLRALDSLIKGVAGYQEIAGSDTYGASEELMRIYQVILEHLNLDYGIGEERAIEINSYDNRGYSRSIHSIIDGTSSALPEAESQQPEVQEGPQDILPEEEDIIDLGTSDEGV